MATIVTLRKRAIRKEREANGLPRIDSASPLNMGDPIYILRECWNETANRLGRVSDFVTLFVDTKYTNSVEIAVNIALKFAYKCAEQFQTAKTVCGIQSVSDRQCLPLTMEITLY